MRRALASELLTRGLDDSSLTLVTGDLGYSVLEEFRDTLPLQFINAGVAEQAMASLCAGMAHVGKRVFMYSIVNFATFRCLEQIRNDIAYHGLDVCIVAVGAGTSYGTLGYSHHGLEDIAVMRALPNMKIFSPADRFEVEACLDRVLDLGGPSYLRLGHEPEVALHPGPFEWSGGPIELRAGTDVSAVSTGNVLALVVEAADLLEREGISVQVVSMPLVSPINLKDLLLIVQNRPIVTVEDHSVAGGLGTCLLESLNEAKAFRPLVRVGYPATGVEEEGTQNYLRASVGLSTESVCEQLRNISKGL
jgi:transketolase